LNDDETFLCDFDLLARCFEKLASACRREDENMVGVDGSRLEEIRRDGNLEPKCKAIRLVPIVLRA